MDRNIFEAASRKLGKQLKKEKNPPLVTSPLSQETSQKEVSEMDSVLQRLREMQNDLDAQMAELRKKGRQYNVDIDRYIENLTKRYPQDLKRVTQAQQDLLDNIDLLFSPETCIKKNPKSKEKLTKERKSKTVAFRKKWIPMG